MTDHFSRLKRPGQEEGDLANVKVIDLPGRTLTLTEQQELAKVPPHLFSDAELKKLGLKKMFVPKKRKRPLKKRGARQEKPAARRLWSGVEENLVQLLRFQVAEGLVERECNACFESKKNCCCCPDCGLCCHCVCATNCARKPATQRQVLSRTEISVLARLGRCHQCHWPLCSQAFLGFLTFNRTVNKEELLQQHMNQCWNDVIYLICNSGLRNGEEGEKERKETKEIVNKRLPDQLIEDILRKLQEDDSIE